MKNSYSRFKKFTNKDTTTWLHPSLTYSPRSKKRFEYINEINQLVRAGYTLKDIAKTGRFMDIKNKYPLSVSSIQRLYYGYYNNCIKDKNDVNNCINKDKNDEVEYTYKKYPNLFTVKSTTILSITEPEDATHILLKAKFRVISSESVLIRSQKTNVAVPLEFKNEDYKRDYFQEKEFSKKEFDLNLIQNYVENLKKNIELSEKELKSVYLSGIQIKYIKYTSRKIFHKKDIHIMVKKACCSI